ncbi:uncharacterized protein RCC_11206 [Ramularia collo-cygni]|uniref:O-methyltransferase C-terminal domain-containing protein n=1 Tax=Ramularia collo-cygni TaxID=112498 RepID=A0A2D3VQC9_9PEZI|nr:uncharacterized protein RCC_11206 [Ramularia collo-cygni]CZT25474.1 uncharacterized protein RCC_11206 [Ramularia collo-cygni]
MSHDFFDEQPVKGARVYYIHHSVLNDWPDAACLRILKPLVTAMERNYSKLLIIEPIVTDRDADPEITGLDIVMMSLFSACERQESAWRSSLLADAGLTVVKIWTHPEVSESL